MVAKTTCPPPPSEVPKKTRSPVEETPLPPPILRNKGYVHGLYSALQCVCLVTFQYIYRYTRYDLLPEEREKSLQFKLPFVPISDLSVRGWHSWLVLRLPTRMVEGRTLGDLPSPHRPWTGIFSRWSSLATFYRGT